MALQIDQIIQQLRDANENTRLKAANLLTKERSPEAREAIPALKEIFWGDPNPAVKFLAKRALVNLGESIEEVQTERNQVISELKEGGNGGQDKGILSDHELIWKVAADEFRAVIPPLFRLVDSKDESVLNQASESVEQLGTVLTAAPLLEAFEREQTSAVSAGSSEGLATYEDVRDLIHIAKLKHSGINPATAAAMGNLRCPEVLEALIDMLRSANLVLRNNAVRILAELSDPNTIEPLLRLLGNDNPRLESKVIKTVSKVVRENVESQEMVLRAIQAHFRPTESEFKLYSIVEAIGRIGHLSTLFFLRDCLAHPLPRVRANAVEAIAKLELPEDEKIRLLGPALNDDNNRVLANAVAALWHTAARERARAVMEQMVSHQDPWYRASISFALGVIDSPEAVPPLIALVKDAEAVVRRNAVTSVQRLRSRQSVGKLVEFVNDDDLEVRVQVVEQIGRSSIDAYNDVLHLLMIDAEGFPRLLATVVLALGRMKLTENIPTISYYLNDRDERIRANAVEALEAINDPKVMSLINLSVTDSHPRVRANAAKALWRFGELGTIHVVREMVESPMVDMQASGAYALGQMAAAVRDKATLATLPLLVSALRRLPRFRELQAQAVPGF